MNKGAQGFKRENKYLVLKQDDIDKYLKMSYEFRRLNDILSTIGVGRMQDGKKDNTYVVVNEDEPYAEDVWMLIEGGKSLAELGYRKLPAQAQISFRAGAKEVVGILRKVGWDRAADDVELYLGKPS